MANNTNNAPVAKQQSGQPSKAERPAKGRPSLPRLTIETLRDELNARNLKVRLNVISQRVEVIGHINGDSESLATRLHSSFGGLYTWNGGINMLQRYIAEIAHEDQYNPVLEYLNSLEWDGVDHLPELFELMQLEYDDTLSRTLIRKWLLQSYALLNNTDKDPQKAEGVLVLKGPQGVGKTSFFERLALRAEWFLGGASLSGDKDTYRRACTHWIVELGEVESTLKSDIEKVKAFITSAKDEYRRPYGNQDIIAPRRTTLCATANSDRYLIDITGNRRWFTIPFEHEVNYSDLQAFNAEQLWAQIVHISNHGSDYDKNWRLTKTERTRLENRNGGLIKAVKAEEEIDDIFAIVEQAPDKYVTVLITISDWKENCFPDYLSRYSPEQIGKALKLKGVEGKRTKTGRLLNLPALRDRATSMRMHIVNDVWAN